MNSKSTWIWILLAALLAAGIFFSERFTRKVEVGPDFVLTEFNAGTVTSVLVAPAGQREIRVERTNAAWQLVKPVAYPAEKVGITSLLSALEGLTAALRITGEEMRKHTEAEYGFDAPQFQLTIQNRDKLWPIKVGARTAIGNQVYLQILGVDGAFIVDGDWLKLVPREANEWRDRSFVDLTATAFDHVAISNASAPFELQYVAATKTWIVGGPSPARVDNDRFLMLLRRLDSLRVGHFITDDPGAELTAFGLRPPQLAVSLASGTNPPVRLEFGRSVETNAPLVYARRSDRPGVVAVPSEGIAGWGEPLDKFRDHRLITFSLPVSEVEFRGTNNFKLQWQGGEWKVVGEDLPVDRGTLGDFVQDVANMQIMEFKDAVTEADLPQFGLANPLLQLSFRVAATNSTGTTNILVAEVSFGVTNGVLYARRTDERNSVYTMVLAELQKLPLAPWQFRDRQIWHFNGNDVTRLIIRQDGKTRHLIHLNTNQWNAIDASGVIIEELKVEAAVQEFGDLKAGSWKERNAPDLARYSIPTGISFQFVLKNGRTNELRAGIIANDPTVFGAARMADQTWVFELPKRLYMPLYHLQIPSGAPN